ncbi:MAG: universal stress protein [Chlorobium phaeobacteroides]|uniref:UspA domain protein n=1 Tax=Chlorobium phaeobacteroides (strain BS1) TaxID=331678 RepID=B3EPN7_CHLPB|nr:universal stress protein [Chlorobium phaeobacteroides]MBL6956897.1 universal stress protein [Chlorobium phaeobacteroides]NEX14450.1 universal stress protein [Prosthecochloris sp.]
MRILAALDLSDVTDNVVSSVRKIAHASSSTVILLHVLPEEGQEIDLHPTIDPHYHPPEKYYHQPDSSEEGERVPILHDRNFKILQNISDDLNNYGVEAKVSLVHGNALQVIVEQAEKEQVDLIILGSHGHKNLYHFFVGSVCSGLVNETSVPVVIVPKALKKQ